MGPCSKTEVTTMKSPWTIARVLPLPKTKEEPGSNEDPAQPKINKLFFLLKGYSPSPFTFFLCVFPGGSVCKESASNSCDLGSMRGSGRSPGEKMATHSSILAWEISLKRRLVDSSPWGHKESDTTHMHECIYLWLHHLGMNTPPHQQSRSKQN